MKEVFIIITIKSNKIDVPFEDLFIGHVGDNLHLTRQFVLENIVHTDCTHRLYLTFDNGATNYFVLDSEVINGSTILNWTILEEHIIKSGIVTAQIKTFCADGSIIHTKEFALYVLESSEYIDDFTKKNAEFLEYEARLNELIKILEEYNLSNYVEVDRKIAGLSLSADILADELTNSLKTYPVKQLSSAPTTATVGKAGQLGSNIIYKPETKTYKVDLYLCCSADSTNGIYNWAFINSNKINDEQIATAVVAYLEEHPIEGTGADGEDGVGIEASEINSNGELVLTYTDGKVETVGKVVGENGKDGEKGDKGEQGPQGAQGPAGPQGRQGETGANGKDGYTPVKGVDYFTAEEKAEFQAYISEELGKRGQLTPEYANSVEGCTDTSKMYVLPDGYIYAYTSQQEEVFTDVLVEVGYTDGKRINSSGGIVDWTGADVTGYIPVKVGDVIRVKNMTIPNTYQNAYYGNSVVAYNSSKTYIGKIGLYISDDNTDEEIELICDENGNVTQFTVDSSMFTENVAYIVINAEDINETSEVYVNSSTVEMSKWNNTGVLFVSSDYGDEIADHEKRLKLLEANTDSNGVPEYWFEELQTKANAIQLAMETAGRNKSAFLWYTDAHWPSNSKMSPYLLDYLCKNTPINKVNFGGDIIGDPTEFTHDNIKYVYEWRKLVSALPNHHSVIGNHDANHNITDVSKIAYSFLNAPEESSNMVVGGDFYYYIDNPCEKTRYLYLSYLTNDHTEMMAQGEFIVDAIKSAPENWHIVAIAHRWFQYTSSSAPTVGSVPAYESEILQIFDEYNARATHTASNYFNAQDFADGKAKIEFCIGGHIHVDYDFKTDGGIPVIVTTSDTNQDRVPDSEADSGTAGTTTESAVFGIIADYSDSSNTKITVIGVGRGTSRTIEATSKLGA